MFALDAKHLTENHTCAYVRTTHNNTHTHSHRGAHHDLPNLAGKVERAFVVKWIDSNTPVLGQNVVGAG